MNLEQLKNRDYVLVMDKSGSMDTRDCLANQTRWTAAQESTLQLVNRLSELDPDGIDLYMFGSSYKKYPNTTPEKVSGIFRETSPGGGTVLAPVLQAAFDDYSARKRAGKTKPNGEILLVVTDGQPADEREVASCITKFANSLDNADAEYGISFIQVGRDPGAQAFLKQLDDGLVAAGAKHDIVDTKTMDEIENLPLTEVLIAALTD